MTLILSGTDGLSDVDGSAATPAIRGTDTNTGIFFPAADTIAFAEGGTEVARFDSSGNLGIGTSSPGARLVVSGTTASDIYRLASNQSAPTSTDAFIYRPTDNTLGFGTASTERARIDSTGALLVGTTSQIGAVTARGVFSNTSNLLALQAGNGNVGAYMTNNSGTGTWQPFSFCNNGSSFTQIGSITTTASATAYNTNSDYRLKENVQPMTGALLKITALKPVTYTWKADGSDGEGFIAHELAEVVPDAVSGAKDAVDAQGNIIPQGIDTSFLVATLTAAIQEQQTLITSLTARIAALEGAAQ